MKTDFQRSDDRDDEIVRELLAHAALQQVELPVDLKERVRSNLLAEIAHAPHAQPQSRLSRRKAIGWLAGLGAGAAVTAFAIFRFALSPSESWAQVAQAAREKPWMHLTSAETNDKRREIWLSFSRSVSAARHPDHVVFEDHREGVKYEFDPSKKRLFRLPLSDAGTFQSIVAVFQSIFQGKDTLGEQFAEDRIVKEQKRTVEDLGRKWTEYELTLQRGDQTAVTVIRVDASTDLPASLTLTAGDERLRCEIDYPDDGPADIYALGVARDTPVDDRVPTGDAARIVKTTDACRRDLDNYFAVEQPTPLFPQKLAWRKKGDKWRIELVERRDSTGFPQQIPEGVDPTTWWREFVESLDTIPVLVCDGRTVYRHNWEYKDGIRVDVGWKKERTVRPGRGRDEARRFVDSSLMPDLFAYPFLETSHLSTMEFDSQGAGGPPGSVLLDFRFNNAQSASAYGRIRYWLDPKRQYVLLKSTLSDSPAIDNDPQIPPEKKHDTYEYSDFQQSPRGVWYPTVVRRKNAIRDKDKQGNPVFRDVVNHYWLDFHAELPDSLFMPTSREKAK